MTHWGVFMIWHNFGITSCLISFDWGGTSNLAFFLIKAGGFGILAKIVLATLWFTLLPFVLVPVHSLTAPVSMCDLDLLQRVLYLPQLRLKSDSFQPLVVLSDKILRQRVLFYWLPLTDRQFAHQLVGELALALALAVLAEEERVGVRCLACLHLRLDLALHVLVEQAVRYLLEEVV